MNRKYYSMATSDNVATINIYGDITSWAWEELGEMSAVNLSRQLDQLTDVSEIHVFINSYGGEVAEGLAIYNALKRHKAKVKTVCDGFACSIASVIFMAGDERIMNDSSLLMIHNAWTCAAGNAEELRKQADDLEKITQASVTAYKAHSNLSEEEIKALMDAETWILPDEAVEYGFATAIETTVQEHASQNAKKQLLGIIQKYRQEAADGDVSEDEAEDDKDIPEDETAAEAETDGEEPEEEPGEPEPEEEPETPDNTDEEEPTDDGEEDSEDDEDTEETAQKWSGFFNAFMKKY